MLMQTAATQADGLVWTVPPSCPTEEELRGEVGRLFGGTVPDFGAIRVDGNVEATERGFSLRLVVETPDGSTQRRLDAPSCEPLVDSAALYIAMAVDPVAMVSGAANEEPDPQPEPQAEVEPQSAPEAPPPPQPLPRRAFDLRASGGAALAAYSEVGGVAALTGSFVLGPVRLELGGNFAGWTPIPLSGSQRETPSAAVLVAGGEARVCPSFRRVSIELFGCAGIQAGLHRARGLSVDRSEVARQLSVDALVGTGLSWWVAPRVGLWLEPDMVVGLYRPRFVVDGVDGSLTAAAVSARVTLGVAIRLWEAHGG